MMNWDKSKNILIIVLLLLNIIISCLLLIDRNKYILSHSQEVAIKNLLLANNITLSDQIPKKYAPMAQINALTNNPNTDFLCSAFFPHEDIQITQEFGKTIITSGVKKITVDDEVIVVDDPSLAEKIDLSDEKKVFKMANQYFKAVESKLKLNGYQFDNVKKIGEYNFFTYTKKYNNSFHFNEYIKLKIGENGVQEILFSYPQVEEEFGIKRKICSVDEALASFMDEIRSTETQNIHITKIDLGFAYEDAVHDAGSVKEIPVYRIYTAENDEPFFINAYVNEVKK